MSYRNFAYHYDQMMADVDYTWWLGHMKKYVKKEGHVLDVGCGTGTLSFMLAKEGYAVTGLDLSEDMLVVAGEKAKELGLRVDLVHQDMRRLTGPATYDGILMALDTINYLENEGDVLDTLQGAYQSLNDGGILIFDVHTPHKMTSTFNDYLYVENDDDLTYVWHVEPGDVPLSVIHELTIFSKNPDGSYQRSIEYHRQRTFEIEKYDHWLKEIGFTVIALDGDKDRQLFIVRKGDEDETYEEKRSQTSPH